MLLGSIFMAMSCRFFSPVPSRACFQTQKPLTSSQADEWPVPKILRSTIDATQRDS